MINSRRKKGIIGYSSDTDYRTLKDIADKFAIPMSTAQRDINELAEENLVKKLYGGVSLARKEDSTFQSGIASYIEEKQRTTKYAAALVNDNDLLCTGSGPTTSLLTGYLHKDFHLTIIINNIYAITKVIKVVNWDSTVVGSRLKHSSCFLTDVYDRDCLNSLNINKTFLATAELTVQGGAANPDNAGIIIEASMMKRSQENFLLADSSKFDRTSSGTFTNAGDFDKIITPGLVPKRFIECCAAGSTQLTIA